jgi:tRNA (guanine26-N2/guanine27-N2)-dimethyltransferase
MGEFTRVLEDGTSLWVPSPCLRTTKGPAKRAALFYNPAMGFARSVTVVLLRAVGCGKVLDGLAGIGARGLRIAKEAGVRYVLLNDKNPHACEFIKKNIAENALEGCARVSCKDLNLLLCERERFEYIDIDPYGSAAPFLANALRNIKHGGLLGATATDTASLYGAHPRSCYRRYHARVFRSIWGKELGIRILLGFCARVAATQDAGIVPILVHATEHYFRVYFRVHKKVSAAERALANLKYLCVPAQSHYLEWHFCDPDAIEKNAFFAGPLWAGKLYEKAVLVRMLQNCAEFGRVQKMLSLWFQEAEAPALFFDTVAICKRYRMPQPKVSTLLKKLAEKGIFATPTHFSPTAVKTSATLADVCAAMRELA